MGFREKIREKKEKKLKLDEIDKKISEKKSELESLKTEIMELKNFIDQKFESGEFKSDYNVDITDCYIIGVHGKKYITRKRHIIERVPTYSNSYVEIYKYSDLLNTYEDESGDLKCRNACAFGIGYFDDPRRENFYMGVKPDYEKHILEVYPELAYFIDGMVPDAYLKKIYYEINDLSSKKLEKLI